MVRKNQLTSFIVSVVYGVVFILTVLPSSAELLEAEAGHISWSGYWWSTVGGGLVNGYGTFDEPAPMEKYELLTLGRYPDQATSWESVYHFDPDAESWHGQCHAWASAAAYENIDIVPSVIDSILFRVGDKKGLLTASHYQDSAIHGAGDPETFHAFLLNYLYENKRAFVADLGSSSEAWFYPIYRFSMTTDQQAATLNVHVQVWYADDQVHPDFQGTVEKSTSYDYSLELNGAGEVVDGEWLDGSVASHPKALFYPLSPKSDNPYLDYTTIKDIAVHRDDELESSAPILLPQGDHDLILLDIDEYYLDCKSGDTLKIIIEKNDTLDQNAFVTLVDEFGNTWLSSYLQDSLVANVTINSDSRFFLNVSLAEYSSSGIYKIHAEIISPSDVLQPSLRRGSAWNGCVVTNNSGDIVYDVSLVGCDMFGRPVIPLKPPVDLQPGEKLLFTLGMLDIPSHKNGLIYSLKLTNGSLVDALFLGGDSSHNMSGFYNNVPAAQKLVIPDTVVLYCETGSVCIDTTRFFISL